MKFPLLRRKERPCPSPGTGVVSKTEALSVAARASRDLKAFARGLLPAMPAPDPTAAPDGAAIPNLSGHSLDSPLCSVGAAPPRVSGGTIKRFLRDLEKDGFDVLEDGPMSLDLLVAEDGAAPNRMVISIPVMLVPVEGGN